MTLRDVPPARSILDVRPADAFERCHRDGSVNIPLEDIRERLHELPPRGVPIAVFDSHDVRARWARSRLRARERLVSEVCFGEAWLNTGSTMSGPTRDRLWEPHALLVETIAVARRLWGDETPLRALDLACGTGRDAVYLAMAGFEAHGWDHLPDALERCRDLARRHGVAVTTRCCDLELEAETSLALEPFDLVSAFNFLHRPLMPRLAESVRPGGIVVYETFVRPQTELFGRPRRPEFVLEPGELPAWFEGWEIIAFREGLAGSRRMVASLAVRKSPQTR